MRDAAGEQTQRLHLLRLHELLRAVLHLFLQPRGVLAQHLVLHLAPIDLHQQRQQHEIEHGAAHDRDRPDHDPAPANGVLQPVGRLVHLDDAEHAAAAADDRDIDLGERAEGALLVALLGLAEPFDLDLDLARKRALQLVVAGKPLTDEPRLVRPEDLRLPAPHLHANDLGQRGDRRRERAAPALLRAAVGRGAEDALQSFALDLTPDQRRGVLPFPLGDGPCEQRGNGVTHPETEHDRAEQTEQREPRDDRVLEQVHPGATGATRVPRSSTYRWCRETARSPTARPGDRHRLASLEPPAKFRPAIQRSARVVVSARSTAAPAATSDAASAQNTAGYEPRPTSSSEAPTGPKARALLAPSATAPEIAP